MSSTLVGSFDAVLSWAVLPGILLGRRLLFSVRINASGDVKSRRITRYEQASANRWHPEIRLDGADQVDPELRKWLRQAYELAQ
jgi:hypothetical protein